MAQVFGAIGSAAGLGSAAGASTAMTTISQVLSVGSALSAIGQGFAARDRARTEAAFARTEAAQEEARGASEARDLAREYAELRSEQETIQAANNIDIGIGTPINVRDATQRQADRNVSITRENARNRARMSRMRSRGLMSEGRSAVMSGFARAGQIGAEAMQLTG